MESDWTGPGFADTWLGCGNMVNRSGTTVTWNSDNLPVSITQSGSNSSQFSYALDDVQGSTSAAEGTMPGAAKHRYYQSAMIAGVTETTVYAGAFEAVTTGGTTKYRYHLSADSREVAEVDLWNSGSTVNEAVSYVLSDHLGSVDVVQAVNASNGTVISTQYMSFSAWGGRRAPTTWLPPVSSAEAQADHNADRYGFTHQEMLDNVGIVHMNGRIYDPNLGRFLSVDPVFEFPTNTQSLNPYSYVLNNPLSMTDPTGYTATCTGSTETGATCDLSNTKASDIESIQKTSNGQLVVNTKDGNSYAVNNVSGQTAGGNSFTTSFNGNGYSTSFSNGEQNSSQGPGTGVALSTGSNQGANTAPAASNTVTQTNAATQGTAQLGGASLGNPPDALSASSTGAAPAKKDPFDIDLLAPGDKAYAPAMTYVRTPETAKDFIVVGHGNEPWGTQVTDETNRNQLVDAVALTNKIVGSKTFQEHPREVMLMICFGGKNLSALAAEVSKDLWDEGYQVPVSGPSLHGNINNGIYFQDRGGRQRTFLDGKEVIGPPRSEQTNGP